MRKEGVMAKLIMITSLTTSLCKIVFFYILKSLSTYELLNLDTSGIIDDKRILVHIKANSIICTLGSRNLLTHEFV